MRWSHLGILAVFVLIGSYLFRTTLHSKSLHGYVSSDSVRGWKGKAHRADDDLGFEPIPNARALHTFPIGSSIPMAYDSNGFRIPIDGPSSPDTPDVLFLGCSFTYGDACLAEETFAHQLSVQTGFSYINAGVCSYGLSQMVIRAQKLIYQYRPKYVVVQYSPWLVQRSLETMAPTKLGLLPAPYFYEENDKYLIASPLFNTQLFDLDKFELRKKHKNGFSFLWNVGATYFIREDFLKLKAFFQLLTGQRPKPAESSEEIEHHFYREILAQCKKANAELIVLNLGDLNYTHRSHQIFEDEVRFAEGDSLLYSNLSSDDPMAYKRAYFHWRVDGNDSVVVDRHPNPQAHKTITQSLLRALKGAL